MNASNTTVNLLEVHLQLTRFAVQKVITPVIASSGIILNILNVLVLSRRNMRCSSTNTYLFALAICDIGYLTLALTLTLKHYNDLVKGSLHFERYYLAGRVMANVFSNAAVWLTLTFTVERYVCVCFPMRGKAICTPYRARSTVLVVCSVATLLTLPQAGEKKVVQQGENITTDLTSLGDLASYQWGYVYTNQVRDSVKRFLL